MNDWLSICCTAIPLYDIHEEEGIEPIGICGQCREHTTFEKEENIYKEYQCTSCEKIAKVTLEGVLYCVKCYNKANKEKE